MFVILQLTLAPNAGVGAKKSTLIAGLAEVLAALKTGLAAAARVADPGDGDAVADAEIAHGGAGGGDGGDGFVPREEGVVGYAPVVVAHVNVGVA